MKKIIDYKVKKVYYKCINRKHTKENENNKYLE